MLMKERETNSRSLSLSYNQFADTQACNKSVTRARKLHLLPSVRSESPDLKRPLNRARK